jgi:hypothetical protein
VRLAHQIRSKRNEFGSFFIQEYHLVLTSRAREEAEALKIHSLTVVVR